MTYFDNIIYNQKYLVILISLIIQAVIFKLNVDKPLPNFNPDAASAVLRSKTEMCKAEIAQLAYNQIKQSEQSIIRLPRRCKRDKSGPRIYPVSCVGDKIQGSTQLEYPDKITNLSLCLDLCFSYGHAYGGLNRSEKKCYCGDKYIQRSSGCPDEYKRFTWYRLSDGIYNPLTDVRARNYPSPKSNQQIRIAFLLIFNGRSVLQVRRLIKSIYDKKHLYYIHVDKRRKFLHQHLSHLEQEHDNVIVTSSRFATLWGSPILLSMMLDAMMRIHDEKWDFLINLSESDFPIKNVSYLEDFLLVHQKHIFLKTHNMRGYRFIKKQGLDRIFHQCDDHVWRLGERILPHGVIYSGGSDWFALPRDFCNYIIDEMQSIKLDNESLVNNLLKIFKQTLLPAESFFHTVALNSEFCDRFQDENLRLTNWHRKQGCKCQHKNVVDWCGCSPMIYRAKDWAKLEQTQLLESVFFSRKFDPTISASIVDRVEKELVSKSSISRLPPDSRYWLNAYHEEEQAEGQSDRTVFMSLGRMVKRRYSIGAYDGFNLRSVDIFHQDDRPEGYLLAYCNHSYDCIQILLKKNSTSHIKSYDHKCLGTGDRRLIALEVGHGFDPSEKAFRDHAPIHEMSQVVVYHEWLVQSPNLDRTPRIRFSWMNPRGEVINVQDARLKLSKNLTRLTLAHKLDTDRPILPGLWTLMISSGRKDCLQYQFYVMNTGELLESNNDFFLFFYMADYAKSSDSESELDKSSQAGWTLNQRQKLLDISYALS